MTKVEYTPESAKELSKLDRQTASRVSGVSNNFHSCKRAFLSL